MTKGPRRSSHLGFLFRLTSGALVGMLATGSGLSAASQPAPSIRFPMYGLRSAPGRVARRVSQAAPDLYFAPNSCVLGARGRRKLDEIAPALESLLYDFPNLIIVIEGYSDDHEYNDRLAWERAEAVRRELLSFSFPQERLRTASFGNSAQRCAASDEGCSRRNRRVHFRAAQDAETAEGEN